MKTYDTTFIIDGSLPTDQREAIIAQYQSSLKRHGAEIEQTVRWGMRQLAYPINKQTHGYYVIVYFNAEPSILSAFHREFDLNEQILRYMTMLWDGKHPQYVRDEGAPGSTEAKPSAAATVAAAPAAPAVAAVVAVAVDDEGPKADSGDEAPTDEHVDEATGDEATDDEASAGDESGDDESND